MNCCPPSIVPSKTRNLLMIHENILVIMSGTTQLAANTYGTAEVCTTADGRQAVCLPVGVRLEGDTVRVREVEGGILLQPAKKPMTREEVHAFFARLDSYGADPLFPEGRNQGITEPEDFLD
jgi:virulence-associated protein VagC